MNTILRCNAFRETRGFHGYNIRASQTFRAFDITSLMVLKAKASPCQFGQYERKIAIFFAAYNCRTENIR